MSSQSESGQELAEPERLGDFLRRLRTERELALREVAPAADMDSTLLSKVELGQRLPTPKQAAKLAAFFGVPAGEMEGRRILEKFLCQNQGNPALANAVERLQEMGGAYTVNKPVNKRRKTS